MVRGYKRGDEYAFEIQSGLTRRGKVVRSDKESITIVYNAEKNLITRTISKMELRCQKKNKK